jgi:hypothetical protein
LSVTEYALFCGGKFRICQQPYLVKLGELLKLLNPFIDHAEAPCERLRKGPNRVIHRLAFRDSIIFGHGFSPSICRFSLCGIIYGFSSREIIYGFNLREFYGPPFRGGGIP